MEELGEDSERLHADVGRYAVNAGLRKLIAYGRYCDLLGPDSNDHKTEVYRAKTKGQLDALLKAHIRKGDVVLFKASNAVHLERRVLKRFWFSLKAWKAFFQYFF